MPRKIKRRAPRELRKRNKRNLRCNDLYVGSHLWPGSERATGPQHSTMLLVAVSVNLKHIYWTNTIFGPGPAEATVTSGLTPT